MSKKLFIGLWATVQVILFILPILATLWYVPYEIDYDTRYVKEVNTRAFNTMDNEKLTDFKDATVAGYDASGTYLDRAWKLDHRELYTIWAIIAGMSAGGLLQILNIFWWIKFYDEYWDE